MFNTTSLWIEAHYCREEDHCKSEEEIQEWKEQRRMFAFITNYKHYQPNTYGDGMVLEDPTIFYQFEVNDNVVLYELQ